MSKNQSSNRIQRARSELSHRRTSMDSIMTDFRNKFLQRLRLTRSKSVDRLRQIVETYDNDTQYTSLRELRKFLLSDKEASELISSDEVNDLLKEVEQELRDVSLEYEVEKYANENQKEVEDAVDRLMDVCQVCGNLSVGIICQKCNVQISSEFR